MSDLAHTMVVCGLISGTQPLTIMGMLLVLGERNGSRNVWWYILGSFSVQLVIVLVLGLAVGGTVGPSSSPGRGLVGLRIAVGVVLVAAGFWFRRELAEPAPDRPKVLDRLADLSPLAAFVAGVAIADYQGSVLAAAALMRVEVGGGTHLLAWGLYVLLATGIPVAATIAVIRSERAKGDLERAIAWVMRNRRKLASWFCFLGGAALVADGLTTLLTSA